MKRVKRYVLLLVVTPALFGCALADLRTPSILTEESQQLARDGRRLLSLAVWRQDKSGRWEDFETWTLDALDVWESGLIRRFTPLTQNSQQISFRFRLDASAAEMTFLDGKSEGITLGVDESGQFRQQNGRREYGKVPKLENYLEPVRDYFFWPQTLVNYPTVLYAGEGQVDDQEYHMIFVSDGEPAPSADRDQYVVWLSKTNLRVEFVEFTLRSLLKSYRGAVRYEDYREVEGMRLPTTITLLDRVGGQEYSHQFIVNDMSFTLPERELGFVMEIQPFNLDLGLRK